MILITRHSGLVEYLREEGIEFNRVIAHATPEDVRGQEVWGVLPLALAAEAASVTEVKLELPAEMRGVELNADQVREFQRGLVTYKVTRV